MQNADMKTSIRIVGLATLAAGALWAAPASGIVGPNVIVNGDFESGPDWGGTTAAPDGWTQVDGAASAYLSPSNAPISGLRSLVTEGDGGTRGQLTVQGFSVGPKWQLRFDFALEDPALLGRDELALSLNIRDSSQTFITMWIRDNNNDNGVGELWFREPAATFLAEPAGFEFTEAFTNAVVSNVVHEMIIDGYFNEDPPTFDVTLNFQNGSSASFEGLTNFKDHPSPGDVPTEIMFVGDSFSTGRGKIDNVVMGTILPDPPPITTFTRGDVTGLEFSSTSGHVYKLDYTVPPETYPVDTGVRIVGDGGTQTAYDPEGFDTGKVYRVLDLGM